MDDVKESDLDLVVAGTQEGVLMVESMATELSEEVMLGAVNFGHDSFQPIIQAIIELAEACAQDPMDLPAAALDTDALRARLARSEEHTSELQSLIRSSYAVLSLK